FGGIGPDANVVSVSELFDPHTNTVETFEGGPPEPRAFHSANLLTDGRLLIAGGVSAQGAILDSIEFWDYRNHATSSFSGRLSHPRKAHRATLLPDGRVMFT